jgi:UDP-N-acetylmuramoyl-tripeptide--D-alanyl-D-alanine ligase
MIRGILSIYSPGYPRAIVDLFRSKQWRIVRFLSAYWQTKNYAALPRPAEPMDTMARSLTVVMYAGMIAEIAGGLALLALWYWRNFTGGWEFGVATILAYPVVWAHILALLVFLWKATQPKRWGRAVVCAILERQVRRLRAKHDFTVVAVAGSVGKTSTKIAIAKLLQASRRVLWQEGNYNDRVTVPLIFFDQAEPNLLNVFAWLRVFWQNNRKIRKPYPYQYVVAELGTDQPYYLENFAYVQPDLAVLTAITPEHMEFFGTLDAVAAEETAVFAYAKKVLVNIDDTPVQYLTDRTYKTYGLSSDADFIAKTKKTKGLEGQHITFALPKHEFSLKVPLLGGHGAKIALAAVAAAHMLELPKADIEAGAAVIGAFAGRMQILPGIQGSTIIDDTYNSSPVAAKAALDVLQSGTAPQRIAILGTMGEMGGYSKTAHEEVGEYCDPTKLDWVITIGSEAKKYLAPTAKKRGCQVKTFLDPYSAGRFAKKQLKEGAIILAKGSQNGVFSEESLKVLLADKADEAKLVRQSPTWMAKKRQQFTP